MKAQIFIQFVILDP